MTDASQGGTPPIVKLSDDRVRRLLSIAEENIDRGYGKVEVFDSTDTAALLEEVIEARASQAGTPPTAYDKIMGPSFTEVLANMSESLLAAEIGRHVTDSRGKCACGHKYVVLGFGIDWHTVAEHVAKAITEAGWRRG